MVQVPTETPVMVELLTVQTPVVALLNVTGRPEDADALAVLVPPTMRLVGLKLMGPIVWLVNPTAMF